jgi:hypothetical protein
MGVFEFLDDGMDQGAEIIRRSTSSALTWQFIYTIHPDRILQMGRAFAVPLSSSQTANHIGAGPGVKFLSIIQHWSEPIMSG